MSGYTPGPWRLGKASDAVVCDAPDTRSESHVEYYGGNLIAESISPSNRPIIAAAPALLASLCDLVDVADIAPEPNCHCFISAPCGDCVEWAHLREVIANARAVIAEAEA